MTWRSSTANDSVTYAELEQRSNQVANLLLERGVRKGDRVGLYLDKSLESVVGIYGVLKAGAAYVPLDPEAPAARLAYIARDCGIELLLTRGRQGGRVGRSQGARRPDPNARRPRRSGSRRRADAVGYHHHRPRGDRCSACSAPQRAVDRAGSRLHPLHVGLDGQPEGRDALPPERAGVRRVGSERFAVRADDRLSNHAPLHFDLSIFDLFAAAIAGANVTLVPRQASVFPVEIVRFIEERGITVWYSVPSILTMLTLRGNLGPGSCPQLRTILFAGEVFPTKYLRRLMAALPHVGFFNLYGPTETNVCTYYEVPPLVDDEAPIPIGEAIPNVEVFAVTADGHRARPGEDGELCVRGPTVMQGYWGDPERTARSLVPDPLGNGPRDPVYRTGDLVRCGRRRAFQLLGRRDHQIKSRGYRIELQEIESTLHAHAGVVECAVIAIPDELITNRIVACLVVRDGVDDVDLARFCAGRIPRYMIPDPSSSSTRYRRPRRARSTDRRFWRLTGWRLRHDDLGHASNVHPQ